MLAWALFLQASPVEGELTNPDTTIRELVNQAVKKDFFRYTAEVRGGGGWGWGFRLVLLPRT